MSTCLLSQERKIEKFKINDEIAVTVASPWQLIDVDSSASLRGLHVYSENEIFASGTNGTIIRSVDGGKTWKVTTVKGAEELDFRDVFAIDDATLVAMTSGTPACVYRSTNGGISWKLVYRHPNPKVFLDAISFWDDQRGIIMGDPIDNRLFLLLTEDGGRTWKVSQQFPQTEKGEAGFAASGTNMITIGKSQLMVALGSGEEGQVEKTSRVVINHGDFAVWKFASVPISRSPSAGIFSLCFANEKNGVAVGGDYQKEDSTENNYAVTRDGGKTWSTPNPRVPPSGYRSCVAVWIKGREVIYISVGPNGTDASTDLGNKWKRISNEGFHAVDFTKDGKHGWAVGSDGRLAKWLGLANAKPVNPKQGDQK